MANTGVVGSWFPTGFHGHLRSRPRNDFVCEFRKLARPQPPNKFIARSQVKPTAHVFSAHDNRSAFFGDALYFEQGLGRRRDPNKSYRYKRDFISWVPPGRAVEDYPNYPLASTYRLNFQYDEPGKPVPQIIVKRPMTSFEGVPTTTYRYSHSNTKHTKEVLDAMTNAAFVNVSSQKPHRSQKPRPESVASCMTWHVPEPPKRTRVPSATQTTDFTQVPVSTGSSCQINISPSESKSGTIAWPHPPQAAETA
ncbi:uncharacterized protein C3orf84-like [Liolophura sinensis]|uniref:uncharacterized protein C3orf84-like n=1 Tax=Liolophura sinensis TaxID=3198878 RepID=UPI003159778A